MFTPLRASLFLSVAVLGTACMPKTQLRVLEPAAVDVPSDIQVIGVVDRSRPSDVGGTVLGALEGLITGETLGADTQGREAALEAAIRVLEESPRFDVVIVPDNDRNGSSLFDRELDHRTVERICRQVGCDALLALEAFDSDSALQVNGITVNALTNPEALKRQVQGLDLDDVSASSETTVMASFRMYDADQDRVVDELRDRTRTWRWQETGSLVDVRRAMPQSGAQVGRAASQVGADYAARIAPSWQWVQRRYYGGGDPRLKDAKRYVKAGDWEGAMRIWQGLLDSPDSKVRGRAAFNMALAHEAKSEFSEALDMARRAAVALNNGKSRDYVFTLEQRERDEARLARQMTPAPETPVASTRSSSRTRGTGSGSDIGGRTSPRGAAASGRSSGSMSRPR